MASDGDEVRDEGFTTCVMGEDIVSTVLEVETRHPSGSGVAEVRADHILLKSTSVCNR